MAGWKDKVALTAQRNRQEIVKAKLNRREMMRLGLLTAGGSLILTPGLSSRAFGALTDPDTNKVPPSPPVRPWAQPMPFLTVQKPVEYHNMAGGAPDGTTPTAILILGFGVSGWWFAVQGPSGGGLANASVASRSCHDGKIRNAVMDRKRWKKA